MEPLRRLGIYAIVTALPFLLPGTVRAQSGFEVEARGGIAVPVLDFENYAAGNGAQVGLTGSYALTDRVAVRVRGDLAWFGGSNFQGTSPLTLAELPFPPSRVSSVNLFL